MYMTEESEKLDVQLRERAAAAVFPHDSKA